MTNDGSAYEDLLTRMYVAFNARDIDTVLSMLAPDVDWPNGMEGGRVSGRDGVRDYWSRQFAVLDPRVDPERVVRLDGDRIAVEVKQVVRDLSGKLVVDQMVRHTYTFRDGFVIRMDIEESQPAERA